MNYSFFMRKMRWESATYPLLIDLLIVLVMCAMPNSVFDTFPDDSILPVVQVFSAAPKKIMVMLYLFYAVLLYSALNTLYFFFNNTIAEPNKGRFVSFLYRVLLFAVAVMCTLVFYEQDGIIEKFYTCEHFNRRTSCWFPNLSDQYEPLRYLPYALCLQIFLLSLTAVFYIRPMKQ